MGIYIPAKFGYREAKEPEFDFGNGSINGITTGLGYHPDQVHIYDKYETGNFQVKRVAVEVFTKNIVYVMADSTQGTLNKNKVDYYMRDFSMKDAFSSYNTETILTDGISNESLTASYLSKVLHLSLEDNGVFFVDSLGLYLFFNNGLLTDFSSADGLGVWAKRWKELNPQMVSDYELRARYYWGDKRDKIIKEVNAQADAWAAIPHALSNEFIPLHTDKDGFINFVMLQVCHYDRPMDLTEFLEINFGRFIELPDKDDLGIRKFKVDRFVYEFLNGVFLLSYQE